MALVGPLVGHAVAGSLVSLLIQEVLRKVKLLAEGDKRFSGLQSLLSRVQEPAEYLLNHEDEAGEPLVHKWLQDLRREVAKAEDLVTRWPKIRRWNLRERHTAVKRLIRITENLQRLDNSQTVNLASSVRNFDRLGAGVGSLGQGVDRVNEGVGTLKTGVDRLGEGMDKMGVGLDRMGEEVKICVESLTAEARILAGERREFARATEDALAQVCRGAFREQIEEIKSRAMGTSRAGAKPQTECGPSQSSEVVTHFSRQGLFPDEVFGGDAILDKVVSEILHGEYCRCIGLWNMGGAGKTFTAGRVYHNQEIQNYFDGERHRIWVTVSKRSTYSVLREIFIKLGGQERSFPPADDIYSMRTLLKRQLNQDKFLLVIDDVWEANQLNFLDLISERDDSKRRVILVTTRLKEILDRHHATKIQVSLLSEDDSWSLFSKNAFGRALVPSELTEVSRSVAAECKGLPLALKVIGSTMAGETDVRLWNNSLRKLKYASILSKEHEEQLYGRLQLSVDNLRDRDDCDSRLQHCFYYFAAYPEDDCIDAEELVRMWTSEGIVGKDLDSPISPESEAYELLGTLLALSMIEIEQNAPFLVKMHDVMRDLARYNLENNFGKEYSTTTKIPACQRLCLHRPGLQLREFPKAWCSVQGAVGNASTTFSVERLSLMSNLLQKLPEQFDAPHLRVLMLNHNVHLESLNSGFFKTFRSLRVLNLSGSSIEDIPEAICNLISLVLLDLQTCDFLRQISPSIGRLQNLQQLRISECLILKSVPRGLRSLSSLKVLDAKDSLIWDGLEYSSEDDDDESWNEDDDVESASEDGSAKSSNKGDDVESSGEEVATLEDVALLNCLQTLRITSGSSTPVSEITQLIALQSLCLHCKNWKELPENITQLANLRSLILGCSCSELPALDQLQHLENFQLSSAEIENLPDSFVRAGAFPSLQTFTVLCQRLKFPTIQPGAMPQIKIFKLEKLSGAKELPASFQELRSLTYLEVSDCGLLESLLAFEEPNSFPHLIEINFTLSRSLRTLPAGLLQVAPSLRRLNLLGTGVSRSNTPQDLLEKEKLKQLEISIRDQ